MELLGEEHGQTLTAANNYAASFLQLRRFEEAKELLRRVMPVARRVLGDVETTLRMRWIYAESLTRSDSATLDDLREAVTTLEEIERIARRVLGGAHPITTAFEMDLRAARAALRAREAPPSSSGGA